jgi:hypothetical protein
MVGMKTPDATHPTSPKPNWRSRDTWHHERCGIGMTPLAKGIVWVLVMLAVAMVMGAAIVAMPNLVGL